MSGWAKFWENHAASSENPVVADGYCIEGVPLPREVITVMAGDIRQKLNLLPSHVFLEVGCGAGLILSYLNGSSARTFGCDLSAGLIQKAATHLPGISFCVSDAHDLPFKSAYFDRVLCYGVFMYFPHEEYAKETLRELIRVTKSGGKILIGEISNPDKLEDYHREKKRLGLKKTTLPSYSTDTYSLKYMNYTPDFFRAYLSSLGCSYNILDQNIPGKITSLFRYDISIDIHGH